jgi:hypothetical protein
MSRVYAKCPQCDGRECADISCKFSGIKHKNAAPQESQTLEARRSPSAPNEPADAAPIGYESARPWEIA